ncbi:hypothetical protein GCM10010327_32920 [Streptomyces nitrosporeus]|nr:hypothetical protein GCM10010327_32920 [Streptomyces nitrosporeus]
MPGRTFRPGTRAREEPGTRLYGRFRAPARTDSRAPACGCTRLPDTRRARTGSRAPACANSRTPASVFPFPGGAPSASGTVRT